MNPIEPAGGSEPGDTVGFPIPETVEESFSPEEILSQLEETYGQPLTGRVQEEQEAQERLNAIKEDFFLLEEAVLEGGTSLVTQEKTIAGLIKNALGQLEGAAPELEAWSATLSDDIQNFSQEVQEAFQHLNFQSQHHLLEKKRLPLEEALKKQIGQIWMRERNISYERAAEMHELITSYQELADQSKSTKYNLIINDMKDLLTRFFRECNRRLDMEIEEVEAHLDREVPISSVEELREDPSMISQVTEQVNKIRRRNERLDALSKRCQPKGSSLQDLPLLTPGKKKWLERAEKLTQKEEFTREIEALKDRYESGFDQIADQWSALEDAEIAFSPSGIQELLPFSRELVPIAMKYGSKEIVVEEIPAKILLEMAQARGKAEDFLEELRRSLDAEIKEADLQLQHCKPGQREGWIENRFFLQQQCVNIISQLEKEMVSIKTSQKPLFCRFSSHFVSFLNLSSGKMILCLFLIKQTKVVLGNVLLP